MTYEKKVQFGGWTKRSFKEIRRKLWQFWEDDFNIVPLLIEGDPNGRTNDAEAHGAGKHVMNIEISSSWE